MELATSDASELPKPSNKSGKSGRPHKPHRLPGLDLRSDAGRLYARHFRALAREYPNADPAQLRDVAALRAALDRVQGDALAAKDP